MPGRYVRISISTNWGDSLVNLVRCHFCNLQSVKWNDETMTHLASTGDYTTCKNWSDSSDATYAQYTIGTGIWVRIDLGVSRLIEKIVFKTDAGLQNRAPKDFTVWVSDDLFEWRNILTAQGAQTDAVQTFQTEDYNFGYLTAGSRDRLRTKGVSLGLIDKNFDANPCSVIQRRSRTRTIGVSLENSKRYADVRDYAPTGLLTYVAADAITGLNDDDPVQTWGDLSGNGKDFSQATLGYRPKYKKGITVSGMPALLWDNSDDRMDCPSLTGVRSVMAVAYFTQALFPTYNGLLTGTSSYPFLCGWINTAYWDPSYTQYKDGVQTNQNVTNAWHIFIATTGSSLTTALRLGYDRGNSSRVWKGYIAEAAAWNVVLDTDAIWRVTNYAKAKYGF